MTRPKIRRAYCKKIGIVTPDQARRESLSSDPPEKYDFFCETPECRAKNVRVIGVAYRMAANEGKKYKQAHFRHQDEHFPGCPYYGDCDEDNVPIRLKNESIESFKRRQARTKLTDFIDIFDPNSETDEYTEGSGKTLNSAPDNAAKRTEHTQDFAQAGHSQSRTSYLDKLVDCYLEAKSDLPREEYLELSICVKGYGEISISQYFKPIRFTYPGIENCVLYGGATLVKRYGYGFKLKFYDKIDDLPIYLYVSPEQMNAYRYQRYLSGIIDQKGARYFKVFAIGDLRREDGRMAIDLRVKDLRHLAIVLPPQIESKSDEEPPIALNNTDDK